MKAKKNIIFVLFCLITIFLNTTLSFSSEEKENKVIFITASHENQKSITSVSLSLSPEGSLETLVLRDIITTYLLQAGIKVISDEIIIRKTESMLNKNDVSEEQSKNTNTKILKDKNPNETKLSEKSDSNPIDYLSVVKEAGGDCIVKLAIVAQPAQQNVYDKEYRRVIEVRTENRISLVTANIIGSNGNILKAGFISYSEPTGIAEAGTEIGKELSKQLRN